MHLQVVHLVHQIHHFWCRNWSRRLMNCSNYMVAFLHPWIFSVGMKWNVELCNKPVVNSVELLPLVLENFSGYNPGTIVSFVVLCWFSCNFYHICRCTLRANDRLFPWFAFLFIVLGISVEFVVDYLSLSPKLTLNRLAILFIMFQLSEKGFVALCCWFRPVLNVNMIFQTV